MRRLILFAKRPRQGRVKTRLVPTLSPGQALGLYRAFLIDQIAFLDSLSDRCDARVAFDAPWDPDPELTEALRRLGRDTQGPGDLGQRLERAFRRSAESGASATVIIGVDSPTLPEMLVRQAFRALETKSDGVVAPAEDGGYVLIGLRGAHPDLFREIPWGSDLVYRTTLQRAGESGIDLVQIAPWYDIDNAAGLDRLVDELQSAAARRRAPATARFLDHLIETETLRPAR
jgi:rSAM/selenodomain-associated transferase 1